MDFGIVVWLMAAAAVAVVVGGVGSSCGCGAVAVRGHKFKGGFGCSKNSMVGIQHRHVARVKRHNAKENMN